MKTKSVHSGHGRAQTWTSGCMQQLSPAPTKKEKHELTIVSHRPAALIERPEPLTADCRQS